MSLSIYVLGATGKMGSLITSLALVDRAHFHLETDPMKCDMFIDFSSYLATEKNLEQALKGHKPIVIGTTGHTKLELKQIEEAAKFIPILFSPNFSFGMYATLQAVSLLRNILQEEALIKITETHHIEKKDAPSGSALALATSLDFDPGFIISRREEGHIGEHTVSFDLESEKIEIRHECSSREAFAKGALKGAQFLINRPPGLYSIKDVYNL